MDSKHVAILKAALDDYDQRQEETRKAYEARVGAKRSEEQTFRNVASGILRPTLGEFGAAIEARGHKCSISEEEQSQQITLEIYPSATKTEYDSREHAKISFASSPGQKITVHIDAQGFSGSDGVLELHSLTKEIIEAKLIAFIIRVFTRHHRYTSELPIEAFLPVNEDK